MTWKFTNSSGQDKSLAVTQSDAGPVGSGLLWFTDTPPQGYLLCQGQSLNRADYPELFNVLGVTYGSASATTFSLPDMRGRVGVGKDGTQVEFDVLGEMGGAKTHTLTAAQLASHSHQLVMGSVAGAVNTTDLPMRSSGGSGIDGGFRTREARIHTDGTYGSGEVGNQPHNNLQPYTTVHYAIRFTSASSVQSGGILPYNAPGKEIAVVTSTVNVSTNALTAGQYSGAFMTMNVTGDGVTPINVSVSGYAPYISAGTAGHFTFQIFQNNITAANTIHGQQFYSPGVGVSGGGMHMEGRLAPFTGTKIVHLACYVNQSSTVTNQASPELPTRMTARWGG